MSTVHTVAGKEQSTGLQFVAYAPGTQAIARQVLGRDLTTEELERVHAWVWTSGELERVVRQIILAVTQEVGKGDCAGVSGPTGA